MALVKSRVAVALAALTVGGCGSPLGSFGGFCDAFAAALCDRLAACPTVPQPIAAECKFQLSGSVCFCGMNSFSTGEEKYHSEKAQACVDAVKQLGCAALNVDTPPPACSLVYGLPSGEKPHCPLMPGPFNDGGTD